MLSLTSEADTVGNWSKTHLESLPQEQGIGHEEGRRGHSHLRKARVQDTGHSLESSKTDTT